MKTRVALFVFILIGLAGCRAAPGPEPVLPAPAASASPRPVTPTAAVSAPTLEPTAAQTATPDPTQGAVEVARAYFTALQQRNYQAASAMTSDFSRLVDQMSPADGTAELQSRMIAGEAWVDLTVGGAQALDDKTVLVQVTYTHTAKDPQSGKTTTQPVSEPIPVRREAGTWKVNRANLVDYRTVDVEAQTTGGLTLQPQQLVRYTDHLKLVFLAQNHTNEAIVLGQPGEIESAFYFQGQAVEGVKQVLVFDRLRSYPTASLEVAGWHPTYPDKIEIRRWKAYTTPPWFTFDFTNQS